MGGGGGKNTQKVYVQRKVALKVVHSEQPRKHFLHKDKNLLKPRETNLCSREILP